MCKGMCQHRGLRLVCLIVSHLLYLVVGAAIFAAIEGPEETKVKRHLLDVKNDFLQRHNSCTTEEQLEAFILKVVEAANRGVMATRNVTMSEPNWSFGQAIFFAATVLTTIGYGRVTPLSDAGKAFCIVYAMVGIPLTLTLFTALTERILIPVRSCLYFLFTRLGHAHKALHIQLFHLLMTLVVFIALFLLGPAAIYSWLEPSWNYLDALYYCFISLTTIGLGDFIPGDSADQPHRALYKVVTTVYLLVGLLMMMVVISVVYDIPELNLGLHFYPSKKTGADDDDHARLRRDVSDMSGTTSTGIKYWKQADDLSAEETQPVHPVAMGNSGTYQSFHKHVDDDVQ